MRVLQNMVKNSFQLETFDTTDAQVTEEKNQL